MAISVQANDLPSRKEHITRLPSSALLGSSLRQSLATQVRIIELKPRQEAERTFVTKWRKAIEVRDPSVAWELLESKDESNHFIALASLKQEVGDTEDTGMLNYLSQLETQVSDLLSAVSNDLEVPPRASQCSVLVDCGVQDELSACVERVQARTGYEAELSHMIRDQMGNDNKLAADDTPSTISTPDHARRPPPSLASDVSDETGLSLRYLALQDLNDSRKFTLVYSYKNEEDVSTVRNSKAWKNWRRRIASCVDGIPDARVLKRVTLTTMNAPRESATKVSPSVPHHPMNFAFPQSAEVAERAVKTDGRLTGFVDALRGRFEAFSERMGDLESEHGDEFESYLSSAHEFFGAHRTERNGEMGMQFREYLKEAKAVWVRGDFNHWDSESHAMSKVDDALGIWEIFIPDSECHIPHLSKYKMVVQTPDDRMVDRVSAWATTAWMQDEQNIIDGIIDLSPVVFKHPRPLTTAAPIIYEVHIGVANEEESVGSYKEAEANVLPHMRALGFNTLLLIGVQEHAYYPSAGWHVTLPFAASSRFGNESELRRLIDSAHGMGIKVIMSVIQSHASDSEEAGICAMDGTEHGGLFRVGMEGRQRQWDGRVYEYSNLMAMRFLVSNLRFWMDHYQMDGFRFEGVSSILYKDHAINAGFDRFDYRSYFDHNLDIDGHVYLMLANTLLHRLYPNVITIANDHVGTPTLATKIEDGGLGFDYATSQHLVDAVGHYLEKADGYDWSLNALRYAIDRLSSERRLAFIESFETTVIGKRPMRIAFFAWETLHTIAVGGIAPHVTELAAALRRVGHEVHIFTRATGAANVYSIQYGVYYHEVTFRLDRDFVQECFNMCGAFVHEMLAWESSQAMTFDLIHGHDWLVARAVTTLKAMGRVCVFTMHSTEAGRCGNKVCGGPSQRIRDIEKDACHLADRVICVSGVLAEEVKSYYAVPGPKIRVVYNGCNVHNFDGFEEAGPVKERYGVKPLEPTILFVGRFVVQKGVDLLVEAAPAVLKFRGDLKFVIVGDGHMRGDVERRAAELGVSHAFRFVGSKTGAELKSLFKMCDAVIIPSRNEPFGIVVLEAWSAYKPVIATTCGGPRDFVTPNVDGFLVDPNPNSIAWGCCEALKNFEHTRWMGERGRVKAAYSFSWDTIGQQTRDIYFELLNKCDCTYGLNSRGNCSLSQRLIGNQIYDHMGVFDNNDWVSRGLCLMRLMQLLVSTLGAEAWMAVMGSEFAHPDWIDFPRPGNNFSSAYARRQRSLASRTDLKYKHYALYTAALMDLLKVCGILDSSKIYITRCDDEHKILVFERSEYLFVLNLSPDRSHQEYSVGHSIPVSQNEKLKLLFNTDETRFNGWNRLNKEVEYPILESMDDRDHSVKLYVPARCGMVLSTRDRYNSLITRKDLRYLFNENVDSLCADLTP